MKMDVVKLVIFMNCAILVYCQSCIPDPTENKWQNEYFKDIRYDVESIREFFQSQQDLVAAICSDQLQAMQNMKSEIQSIRLELSQQKQELEALREKCNETANDITTAEINTTPWLTTKPTVTVAKVTTTVPPPTPPPATTSATTTTPTTTIPTTTIPTTTITIPTTQTPTTATLPPTTPTTTKPRLRPGETCNERLDLVFAFDTSGGLSRTYIMRTVEFAKQIVGQMNISADETRIGAISFSNNIRVTFHLKDTSAVSDAQQRLGRVLYRTGKRDLKQGMNAIRDTMFLEQNGNRATVPNVAIIFTDGFNGEEAATYDEESLSIAERGIELFQIVWQQKGRDVVHTGEGVFAVNSVETLNGILDDVKQAVCDVGQS